MADQYASIIIDISHEDVDRVFQYRIPPAILPQIRVGVQVCVPFGSGNRTRNWQRIIQIFRLLSSILMRVTSRGQKNLLMIR